ncbi:hypothetical protein [Sphingobium lignivorans]|uniref:Phage tail protein n=1 Tax=Sphingobium lignivorans TaxID=2735886 RepID=A0ABR6NDF7_9SPHN|nr:hypothetical protein [Sphingobium lignivorans]MBB5985315.1 hypothetical protein [Sphingobium lignivorans]
MALQLIVTNAGRAAIVNAQNTGTAPVTVAQIGLSATAVTPLATLTALAGEFKRLAALAGDTVADDTIHMIGRDEGGDAYTVRSFALYLADGTLFAIYGQASPIVEKVSASIMMLTLDVRFADIAASALTFGNANFLNPPATETVKGVAELATQAESDAGLDDERIVTPKKNRASFLAWAVALFSDVWRASNDGAGSGLDADLLDGQQGSFYTNIPARLGYTPLNEASYTAADVRAKLVTVDGAGSGIDADLLDGLESSFYTNIPGRLGYTPANKAGDNFTGTISVSDGAGQVTLNKEGSVWSRRSDGTGIYYLGSSLDRFLYYDGTIYRLNGAELYLGAAGSLVWNAGNDGAGSGLDADLLDGQQGSFYTNIPARLGYTPLNEASYTAADVRAKLVTVDGAGSGIDADLLDGLDSGHFTNIPARLGYTPANRAGDTFTGSIRRDANFYMDLVGGNALFNFDAFDYIQYSRANDAFSLIVNGESRIVARASGNLDLSASAGSIYFNTLPIWHSGNDGAGSGLDADLLDGQDSSFYANIPARLGYTPLNAASYTAADVKAKLVTVDGAGSGIDADLLDGHEAAAFDRIVEQALVSNGGYIVYASGRKECWGMITVNADSYGTIVLPTAHSQWVHPVLSPDVNGGEANASQNTGVTSINGNPPTTITVWSAANSVTRLWWRTIGV